MAENNATVSPSSRMSILWTILLGVYLCVYLGLGIRTEVKFTQRMPLPERWMEDFSFYQRAMDNALSGRDPYGSRAIGIAYLYPPPALLIVEIYGHIASPIVQGGLFFVTNVLLLILMAASLAVQYKLSFQQTWWWYALCLGFAPTLELLHIGQINVIAMFGLFLLFYYESASPAASGLGLGLAVATKVSPLLFFGYLAANRKFKVIAYAALAILLLIGLSVWRYGPQPTVDYPEILAWLLDQQQLDGNSQSLVAKLAVTETPEYQKFLNKLPDFLQRPVNWPFAAATLHPQTLQRILTIYLLTLIGLSCLLAWLGRQPREATYILTAFGMVLSPNIVWYHHYVFFLLPILIWIAWSRFNPRVIAWCLLGLLVIQFDRHGATYGLLIHIFGHITLAVILIGQIRDLLRQRRRLASIPAKA
jgi:hypothetical protein